MPQTDDADRLSERDWDMWVAYVKGTTQREIAAQYGLAQSTVSERLKAAKESIPPEERDLVVRRHLDEIASVSRELWKLIDAEPVPAYSNGRRMTMPNEAAPDDPDIPGDQVWDHSGRITAMRELREWQKRQATLIGLDAPTQQEITATVEEVPAIVAKVRAAQEAAQAQERAILEESDDD